jgi:hypothetical protein
MTMANRQTVSGFFDTLSEAQQIVQLLLRSGFGAGTIAISAQPSSVDTLTKDCPPTEEERNTGRFLSSLFGSSDVARPTKPGGDEFGAGPLSGRGTLVTIQVHSALEVDQAVDLLKGGRSVTVSKGEK